jgi:hypothetical protein
MVFHWINGCLATKDNRDSWAMCTTSAECKTVMTAVLMIMSGMDPHTITETWIGMVGCWELVSCSLRQTIALDSLVGSMSRFKEKSCWHYSKP